MKRKRPPEREIDLSRQAFTEGVEPQYKYTRGTWEAVEKDTGCGEIPNRTFTVEYGTDATQLVDLEVGKWRDVDQCG